MVKRRPVKNNYNITEKFVAIKYKYAIWQEGRLFFGYFKKTRNSIVILSQGIW